MTNLLLSAVILAWNPNVETNLAGYKLYQGGLAGVYTNVTTLGLTTSVSVAISNTGIFHFSLSALNALDQESDLANDIIWTNGPSGPTNLPAFSIRLSPWTNHTVYWTYNSNVCDRLESSLDLKLWTAIATNFMVVRNGNWEVSFSTVPKARFFRVRRAWSCP